MVSCRRCHRPMLGRDGSPGSSGHAKEVQQEATWHRARSTSAIGAGARDVPEKAPCAPGRRWPPPASARPSQCTRGPRRGTGQAQRRTSSSPPLRGHRYNGISNMRTTLMFRPHSSWAVVKQHYKNKEKLLWLLCLPLEALETSGLCTTAANPKSWTAFMESLDVEVERL